jgi:hypothetical protein
MLVDFLNKVRQFLLYGTKPESVSMNPYNYTTSYKQSKSFRSNYMRRLEWLKINAVHEVE